jgi:hypothetical protein
MDLAWAGGSGSPTGTCFLTLPHSTRCHLSASLSAAQRATGLPRTPEHCCAAGRWMAARQCVPFMPML